VRGRFIFSDLAELCLEKFDCVLVNSLKKMNSKISNKSYSVDIQVFQKGMLVNSIKNIIIAHGQTYSLKENNHLETNAHHINTTYVCDITLGDKQDQTYFAQEHYIKYGFKNNYSSLLFEQQPFSAQNTNYSPVTVLANKVAVSNDLNSYIIFNNAKETLSPDNREKPIHISLLNTEGAIIAKTQLEILPNSTSILNIKDLLSKNNISNFKETLFLNCIAKGGNSLFSIYTLVINEKSKSLGIEHSLAPIYYIDGNLKNIRNSFGSDVFGEIE